MLDRSKLYGYQEHLANYVVRRKRCGLYLPMGRGKTLIALTAISDMIKSESARRILIVAPKRVAEIVWTAEMKRWSHLKHLEEMSTVLRGNEKSRMIAIAGGVESGRETSITLISRDQIAWLFNRYGTYWETVVIDEAQSFKSHDAKRFESLAAITDLASNVILLSGTPMPQSPIDLWAQMYLIDGGKRLGKNITRFRREHCQKIVYPTHSTYILNPGHARIIHGLAGEICMSMDPPENTPSIQYKRVPFRLSPDAAKIYATLKCSGKINIPGHKQIVSKNAGNTHSFLRQISSGSFYTDAGYSLIPVHRDKVSALKKLISSHELGNCLIVYNYVFEINMITSAIGDAPHAQINDKNAIERWNAGEIQYLIVHPKSAGEGLNLQFGGHTIIWFGHTDNMGLYHQLNARLHRPAQKHPVTVLHLIATGTIEEKIINGNIEKTRRQQAFLDTIKIEDIT